MTHQGAHPSRRLLLKGGTAMMVVLAVSTGPSVAQDAGPFFGIWRYSGPGFASELAIQNNGQFSKLDRSPTYQSMISGSIMVVQNPPVLRLNIQDWSPKEFCGPLGCEPIPMIAAETYRFQFRNASELVLSDANASYVYYRAQ